MDKDTKKEFHPYVPAGSNMPEVTVKSVTTGIILLLIFGAANAYLGLKVGMTVSASIPAAVVSMAIMKGLMRKKGSILENNIVQTIASAGEAAAAGIAFSIPAMYMLGQSPSLLLVSLVCLFGGVLGVVAMVIYRRYLIIKQADQLSYPEGTACAEILIAGDKGGVSAKTVFKGGIIAAGYRVVQVLFGVFPEAAGFAIPGWAGASLSIYSMPSLVGVGYLINMKIAGVMLGGGVLAALVITPLITLFGGTAPAAIFPASATVAELGPGGIWSEYIQYIGAGALTIGGLFEFFKAMPVVRDALRGAAESFRSKAKPAANLNDRTDVDMSFKSIIILFCVIVVLVAVLPIFPVGIIGALLVGVFGFLFVSIASRIVGVVGSSSNPISGMTIATIFASALIFKALGYSGMDGMVASIAVGSIVTVAAAIAGDISQDLKTGYLVGACPRSQQLLEILGVLIFSGVSGIIFALLNDAYVIGSEAMPSPATAVIAVLVKGIFSGQLPWDLLLIGAAIGVMVELLGLPSLPFAIGLYLPLGLTTPIFLGGFIHHLLEKASLDNEGGTLYASGLVAGDAIIGVVGAILTTAGVSLAFGAGWLSAGVGQIVSFAAILCIAVSIFVTTKKNKKAF
jgi:putative OPT family oligopeptide transporter